jgi:hypothetical protein
MKLKILLFVVLLTLASTSVSAAFIAQYSIEISNTNSTNVAITPPIKSSNVLFQVETDHASSCRYSLSKGNSYNNMEKTFDQDFETIHKKTLTGLADGVQKYYVKCKDSSGNESGELEAIFSIDLPISGKIKLSKESPLGEGKVEVTLVTSKVVGETPSLSYSFDGVNYAPIPLFGSEKTWTGYLIISSDQKEQIGSFKFQGRDIEGNLGTDITDGGIFLVDTVAPPTIPDVKAVGQDGGIKLSWSFSESVKEFRVYKSTSQNADLSNFYKSIVGKSFTDTDVEKGKTYYYRVSAVDEAGNEGALSFETYATVLLSDEIVSPTGLEPRFYGLVDSVLSEIDLVDEETSSVKQSFESKTEKEKLLYQGLKLSREIDSAKSELDALRKEVENYKSQSLTRGELDKKLNSGELKLNTIKKKIPENMIVVSEKTADEQITENDLTNAILELNPETSEELLKQTIEKSLETATNSKFKVKTSIYNLEIAYLDGTRKEVSLVKENIESNLERNENISVLEIVPKEIADSALELNIKNTEYNVVKEDTIISFYSDTKEIAYSLDKHIDLNSIGKIKTILLEEVEIKEKAPLLTGYFSLVNFEENKSYLGIIIGVLALVGFFGYFYFIKTNNQRSESLAPFKNKILEAEKKAEENKTREAEQIYGILSENYKNLTKKEKKLVYPLLNSLHDKITIMKNWR